MNLLTANIEGPGRFPAQGPFLLRNACLCYLVLSRLPFTLVVGNIPPRNQISKLYRSEPLD